MSSANELRHWGVRGMKWGVRRSLANVYEKRAGAKDRDAEASRTIKKIMDDDVVRNNSKAASSKLPFMKTSYKFNALTSSHASKTWQREIDKDQSKASRYRDAAKQLRDSANRSDAKKSAKLAVKSKKASELAKTKRAQAKNNLEEAKNLRSNNKLTDNDRKEITRRQVLRNESMKYAKNLEDTAQMHDIMGNPEKAVAARNQAYAYRLQADAHGAAVKRIATNASRKEKAADLEREADRAKRKAEKSSTKAKKYKEKSNSYKN